MEGTWKHGKMQTADTLSVYLCLEFLVFDIASFWGYGNDGLLF